MTFPAQQFHRFLNIFNPAGFHLPSEVSAVHRCTLRRSAAASPRLRPVCRRPESNGAVPPSSSNSCHFPHPSPPPPSSFSTRQVPPQGSRPHQHHSIQHRRPIPSLTPQSCPSVHAKLNSKDLSFVGYTYKNFDAVKGLKHAGLCL